MYDVLETTELTLVFRAQIATQATLEEEIGGKTILNPNMPIMFTA